MMRFLSRFAEDLGDELKCEVRGWNHKVGSFFLRFFQLFLPPKTPDLRPKMAPSPQPLDAGKPGYEMVS